jgi:hypothetical protein
MDNSYENPHSQGEDIDRKYLRDIHYHLPEWMKILRDIYFEPQEKGRGKDLNYPRDSYFRGEKQNF